MTNNKFRKLKVGDTVTLARPRNDYTCGHPTPNGRIYIPAGTAGTVGAVRVPTPTGRSTSARDFVCVDFPGPIRFQDQAGHPVEHWESARTQSFRCSAFAEDLEQLPTKQ